MQVALLLVEAARAAIRGKAGGIAARSPVLREFDVVRDLSP